MFRCLSCVFISILVISYCLTLYRLIREESPQSRFDVNGKNLGLEAVACFILLL